MNAREHLSDDGQAMLLLCSSLALPPAAAETDLSPLKLSEWNQLERKIRESSWKHPAALHGRSADELAKTLALSGGEAERIARLLEFAGELSVELQNHFERGLWAVTRVDEHYPAHFRARLKQLYFASFRNVSPTFTATQAVPQPMLASIRRVRP